MTVADSFLWHASGTAHRDRPRRAQARTVTLRKEQGVYAHGQLSLRQQRLITMDPFQNIVSDTANLAVWSLVSALAMLQIICGR
jgi:hypothetical protein